jgi:hypothetical protein
MWSCMPPSSASAPASVPADFSKRLGRSDAAIVLFLLVLGGLQIATVQRLESYGADSSVYMGLAHNILATGRYEFNYIPHTVYPPGFPLLLACLSMLTGRASYEVFVRFMPVFSTLALIVWYFVLRRGEGRAAAGAACLLAATSAPLFQLVTQSVLSEAPYFLMSGLALMCLLGLERPDVRRPARLVFLACFFLATAATVLLRSVGIALCAALLAWTVTELRRHGPVRSVAWRAAVFAALLGFMTFFAWIGWTRRAEQREYQGQHMGSYASQFVMKNPHQPELGTASASEIVLRVASNAFVQASHIAALLSRASYVMPTWYSPPAVITLALLVCGLVSCAFDSRRSPLAWYFLAYYVIYLLWPFDEGARFMLPVLPLALVIGWRGMVVAAHLLRTRPTATLIAISALCAMLAVATSTTDRLPGLQARASVVFWPLVTLVSILMIFVAKRTGEARAAGALNSVAASLASWPTRQAIVGLLIAAGMLQQAAIARTNFAPDASQFIHYRSADCSAWLRTAGDGVVMAQQSEIVHRLSGRRVVRFPITSDPQIILAAVTREKARYLVVNDQVKYEYFFPTEEARWRQIERAYPFLFKLVHAGPGYRVFEIGQ